MSNKAVWPRKLRSCLLQITTRGVLSNGKQENKQSQLGGSADEPVVFGVAADPEPLDAFRHRHAESPVMQADAHAAETSRVDRF